VARILVVGYNAWDVTVVTERFPAPDRKLEVPSIRQQGGGPAATAAVAAARLGAEVVLVTPLADDLPGRRQREELAREGIDLSLAPERRGAETPQAVILVDPRQGRRRILWQRGNLPPLRPEEVDPAWLDGVDLLLCDGHETAAAALLAAAARRRGIPAVMDAGTARPGTGELAASCSDVVASETFATELTGLREPLQALRELRALGPEVVAMTCGEAGAVLWRPDAPRHVPAFAVPVVDTTGAGDAFHGGYAVARAEGWEPEEALRFAAAVAGLKCGAYGGRAGLPDRQTALQLLARGRIRPERPAWLPPAGERG